MLHFLRLVAFVCPAVYIMSFSISSHMVCRTTIYLTKLLEHRPRVNLDGMPLDVQIVMHNSMQQQCKNSVGPESRVQCTGFITYKLCLPHFRRSRMHPGHTKYKCTASRTYALDKPLGHIVSNGFWALTFMLVIFAQNTPLK
jgi:hypothetical protein